MLAIALTQSGDLDERLALAFDMYDYNNTGTSKLNIKNQREFFLINCFILVDTNEMAKVIAVSIIEICLDFLKIFFLFLGYV
jgi:hypothetical protein